MKIGIFTFHCAVNYGAVLQTYCLQEVLKELGHEVYIIDYRPKYLLAPYKSFLFDYKNSESFFLIIQKFLRACLVTPIRWKRNRVFSCFIKKKLNLYQLDLNDTSNDFDVFIFGSDQIWNPKITHGFDKVYLGDFPAAKGKKLVAYAASVGSVMNLASEEMEYFFNRLKNFDKILVREKTFVDYLNDKLSIGAKVVLDPVLLAKRHILKELSIENIKEESHFVLLFQLARNIRAVDYTINLVRRKKLELIECVTMGESFWVKNIKQSLSVEKLLSYFKKASYVITSSFHGTAIAIMFNKQFNTVSIDKNIDERVTSLLELLGLSERMLYIKDDFVFDDESIDYSIVNKLLEKKRLQDLELLRSILL